MRINASSIDAVQLYYFQFNIVVIVVRIYLLFVFMFVFVLIGSDVEGVLGERLPIVRGIYSST